MSRKSTLPKRLQPMLATLTDAAFDDPDWVFEDKYDGFRMVAEIRRGSVALYSRNGKIISRSYTEVAEALEGVKHRKATGKKFFAEAERKGLEGIMAKRSESPYAFGGRTSDSEDQDLAAAGGRDRGLHRTEADERGSENYMQK